MATGPSDVVELGEVEMVGTGLTQSNTNTNTLNRETLSSGQIIRGARQSFSQSSTPLGMFHVYGSLGSKAPSIEDIKKGSYDTKGWSGPGQRRNSTAHRDSDWHVLHLHHQRKAAKNGASIINKELRGLPTTESDTTLSTGQILHDPSVPYENGYQFPPKHSKWKATTIGLRGFWKFVLTPFGFVVTIYALNVVAWGGMLFLLLINAAPAMCHPSCSNLWSGKKRWIEIDSQILNALFCVTGLGLIPWRFRDLYYLLQYRLRKNPDGLRRLAGINNGWFRLQGSENLDVHYNPMEDDVPAGTSAAVLALPITKSPPPPLTGERAPPSAYWKLDFVIWAFVVNTFFQIALCGVMWGFNRFNRPGWTTGLFISVACIVAMAGGWVVYKEGKIVKKIEGVPVSPEDQEILAEMRRRQIA